MQKIIQTKQECKQGEVKMGSVLKNAKNHEKNKIANYHDNFLLKEFENIKTFTQRDIVTKSSTVSCAWHTIFYENRKVKKRPIFLPGMTGAKKGGRKVNEKES